MGVFEGLVLGQDVDEAVAQVVAVAEQQYPAVRPRREHVADPRMTVELDGHGTGLDGGGFFSTMTRRACQSLGTHLGGAAGEVGRRAGIASRRAAPTLAGPV